MYQDYNMNNMNNMYTPSINIFLKIIILKPKAMFDNSNVAF